MRRKLSGQRNLAVLPVAALGALFFTLAMGLALLAGNVYTQVVNEGDMVSARRTALSYLAGQVRRADRAGSLSLGSFGESDALFVREDGYITILYAYDGQLRELYMEEGTGLGPADGLAITPLDSLSIARDGDRLTFTVSDASGAHAASVSPRCGIQEETP